MTLKGIIVYSRIGNYDQLESYHRTVAGLRVPRRPRVHRGESPWNPGAGVPPRSLIYQDMR